jgi:phospholipid/cholesterol/gamma-HCH transport system substrate-binding protein
VTDVERLRPSGVRVTADIDGNQVILDSDYCRISSASVLGDAVIEFVPGDKPAADAKPLEEGAEIQNGIVMGNPMEAIVSLETDMRTALRRVGDAGLEVQTLARTLNAAVGENDDQIPRMMAKAERALDEFTLTMRTVNDLFGDEELRNSMKQSLRELPDTLSEARTTLKNANEAFAGFSTVAERADRNLANLENFTRPLAERGPAMVENIDGSLANLNQLLEQVATFTDGLNNQNGSFGRFMNDPELYDRMNRTLANAEEITFKLKPIMDDVRVMSDKLARDPSILGLKGALTRRPAGVGTKQAIYAEDPYCLEPSSYHDAPVYREGAVFGDEKYWIPAPVLKP